MTKDMTKGNLLKILVSFSIPLILSGLLQQLYSWADAFIVGNIEGEQALAAIGATNVITGLFIMAIIGFASGVSILSAHRFGEGDRAVQSRLLSSFALVLGCAALVLMAVGIRYSRPFLLLLKTPGDIIDIAQNYLQIILVGLPFLTIYNVYGAVLRGIGDSKAPFYAVLLSSVANIILDIVFVGLLRWRAEGAAVATVVSQVLMTVFIIGYAAKKYEMLRFRLGRSVLDFAVLGEGSRLALPITFQSVVTSGGNLILQNFMNSFGTATVAAITTAYRIDSMILLPVFNLATGITTVTSQNFGAKEYRRVHKCMRVGVGLTALVSVGLTGIVLLCGSPLIRLFGVTEEAVTIGADFFRAIAWFYIVFGSAMAMRGYVEGLGKVVFSGLCGIATLALRIILSYVMKPYLGNMSIAWAEAVAWCFQLLAYLVFILLVVRPGQKKEEKSVLQS